MNLNLKRLRRTALTAVALAAGAGTSGFLAVGPAGASNTQVSAVGSFTTFYMMQALFPKSVNDINPNALPYSDQSTQSIAIDPTTCQSGITYSTASQPPNGSGQGKTALANEEPGAASYVGAAQAGCIDFSRSSSPPAPHSEELTSTGTESGDPSGSHLDYYAYALDGVDVLVGSNAGGSASSPVTLTLAQIQEIYSCWNPNTLTPVTTWAEAGIGTSNDTIVRYWPQSGSGTRAVYTDVLGFDPTVLSLGNHCTTAPISSFTANSITYPMEENTEDGIIYNQKENGVSDADAIYIYSSGKFTQQWDDPSAYNSTANNRVATGVGDATTDIGNFDPNLTLASIEPCNANTGACQSGVSDAYVDFTPVHGQQGTMSVNSAVVSEANEWYSHLPAGDTSDPSDSTSEVPGIRYVYNVADFDTPMYNGAKALIGFDNQPGGTASALCRGDDAAIIAAQGFVPLSNNSGNTAPAGSDQAGATCREFQGLSFPGQVDGGYSWTAGAANT